MTPEQLAALKTYINSVPAWAALPNDSTNALFIAGELNKQASPAWYAYKWQDECGTPGLGRVISYVALAALTTSNRDSWSVFYQLNPETYDPSRTDVQNFMANIWSGALGGDGASTRAALLAYGYRTTTLGEKVLSNGAGTTASPATMTYRGEITYPYVQEARSA